MPNYAVTFLTGDIQTVTADSLERVEGQYVGYTGGVAVAYIPINNVLSVVRLAGEVAPKGATD